MRDKLSTQTAKAILHALPTAVIALDSLDNILIANNAASKLLGIPRENLEGGPISRYTSQAKEVSSSTKAIAFSTGTTNLTLAVAAKDVVVDDEALKVLLLRGATPRHDNTLLELINEFANTESDPYEYFCQAIVELGITKHAQIIAVDNHSSNVLASTESNEEMFADSPSIERVVLDDEGTKIKLVLVPDSIHGLTKEDLLTVDMFISLVHLRRSSQETASDASGSEAALSLALKAGDMGLCFFDTTSADCYLSDRLATWCGINPDTFSGTLSDWIATFREDDRLRISTLFSQLEEHKKFKTVVNVHTLEGDSRIELHGRPLHENSSHEWVAIARPFRDEQEVEAAWHTRIAMEESARIEAEENLESFENTLIETLLPTTSDVAVVHSRQDAGTWHIARPFGPHAHIYAVGAITAPSRAHAVVGATMVATIADVLCTQIEDVETFVDLVRDHARARDIETSIAAVRVIDNEIEAASLGGASVFISGRSFSGHTTIEATTALSVSSHSEASVESIDVAANGRPWRIMSTVIEHVSVLEVSHPEESTSADDVGISSIAHEDDEIVILNEDSSQPDNQTKSTRPSNVLPMRSGSISPN